jgi:hypothetical protein
MLKVARVEVFHGVKLPSGRTVLRYCVSLLPG